MNKKYNILISAIFALSHLEVYPGAEEEAFLEATSSKPTSFQQNRRVTTDTDNKISVIEGANQAHFEASTVFTNRGSISQLEIKPTTSSSTISEQISQILLAKNSSSLTAQERSLLTKAFDKSRKPEGNWDYVNTVLEKILNRRNATLNEHDIADALIQAEKTGTSSDIMNKITSFFSHITTLGSTLSTEHSGAVITLSDPTSIEASKKVQTGHASNQAFAKGILDRSAPAPEPTTLPDEAFLLVPKESVIPSEKPTPAKAIPTKARSLVPEGVAEIALPKETSPENMYRILDTFKGELQTTLDAMNAHDEISAIQKLIKAANPKQAIQQLDRLHLSLDAIWSGIRLPEPKTDNLFKISDYIHRKNEFISPENIEIVNDFLKSISKDQEQPLTYKALSSSNITTIDNIVVMLKKRIQNPGMRKQATAPEILPIPLPKIDDQSTIASSVSGIESPRSGSASTNSDFSGISEFDLSNRRSSSASNSSSVASNPGKPSPSPEESGLTQTPKEDAPAKLTIAKPMRAIPEAPKASFTLPEGVTRITSVSAPNITKFSSDAIKQLSTMPDDTALLFLQKLFGADTTESVQQKIDDISQSFSNVMRNKSLSMESQTQANDFLKNISADQTNPIKLFGSAKKLIAQNINEFMIAASQRIHTIIETN